MLNAALAAVARGFHIFPVAVGDKVPHRLAGSWGESSTNDVARVYDFWTRIDPQANIGVACKPSQLLVVDLDIPKEPNKLLGTEWAYMHGAYGPMVSGQDLWDEICFQNDGAPDTYSVQTGSGGVHLYFQWPDYLPKTSQASPAKGVIDVRGNGGQWGGYVLAEGSRTASGTYYGIDIVPPTVPPVWLAKLVSEKPQQPAARRPQGIRQPGVLSYSGLEDSVRNAGEGNRNNALLWAARAMCTDGATENEAKKVLGAAAESAGLGSFEIDRTIESAYRIQRQKDGT